MPTVIYEHLIANATPLPPGAAVQSRIIDVRGAQNVSVNVSIGNLDRNIQRGIYFGPTTNNGYAPLREDNFGQTNHLLTSVPVCGPELFVEVRNLGSNNSDCSGTVYAVREVP